MLKTGERVIFGGIPFLGREPKLLKVIGLPRIGQDDDRVGFEVLGAVEHRGQISGGIIGSPVRFADDKGLGLEARMLRMKDHEMRGSFS